MFTLIRRYPFGLLPVWLAVVTINDATAAVAAWQTDFRASQATAKAQNKVLLVAFTGSDWCPWCKKINAEIFEKEAFLTAAHKRFILVNIDFPHKKNSPTNSSSRTRSLLEPTRSTVFQASR